MAQIEIKVPDIGDFKDVAVIELLVKPGDSVVAEQSLITVESDKASMEIPSSHAGVLVSLKVALGDKVSEGSTLAVLEVSESGAAKAAPLGTGDTGLGGYFNRRTVQQELGCVQSSRCPAHGSGDHGL